MTSDATHVSSSGQCNPIEFELYQLVLKDDVYPWDMKAEDEIEGLGAMETSWPEQLSEEEQAAIATKGQQFFQQLAQAWSVADATAESTNINSSTATPSLTALQTSLLEKLQNRVPADIINQITEKAQTLASQPLELADQLIQCVQTAFPVWGTEDLQVLARPYAFAMRSPNTDKLELASQSVRSADWGDLSEVEKARLSLAIAHYSLTQISDTPSS